MLGLSIRRALRRRGVMGINQRNGDYVLRYNPRSQYPLVDDKIATKKLAGRARIQVPELYDVIDSEHDIRAFTGSHKSLRDFVIKPSQGAGGDGILVVTDRFEGHYRTASGQMVSSEDLEFHLSGILSGIYSLGGNRDRALVEYRVRPAPLFDRISYDGVPDIRIIVLRGYPVAAMLRLPTRESQGKANLHQGAIGVGIDLAAGVTLNGTWHNHKAQRHPDTGNEVAGLAIPDWQDCLELASRCYDLTGLGYLGVDLVMDADYGPMMLELNARPGLSIQIANDDGLARRCQTVEAHLADRGGHTLPEIWERVRFSQQQFSRQD
ncbi:MAG: alpha-L-glutamate ligase-like protein [Pseudomonadota bacterium]